MILLVDIGNSRLKWAEARFGSIQPTVSVDYRQADFLRQLRESWLSIGEPQQLAISSVAAKELTASLASLATALWPAIEIIVPIAAAEAFGLKSAYQQPEKLGVDRWLAMLGAHRYYPGASCIVDCGTAITLDFVEADGRHLGGLICPGLRVMKQALVRNTSALTADDSGTEISLANATEAAIGNGVLAAAVGLVETVLRRQAKPYQLILSGGDAERLAGQLSMSSIMDSQLIFKGLLHYCRNEPTS